MFHSVRYVFLVLSCCRVTKLPAKGLGFTCLVFFAVCACHRVELPIHLLLSMLFSHSNQFLPPSCRPRPEIPSLSPPSSSKISSMFPSRSSQPQRVLDRNLPASTSARADAIEWIKSQQQGVGARANSGSPPALGTNIQPQFRTSRRDHTLNPKP